MTRNILYATKGFPNPKTFILPRRSQHPVGGKKVYNSQSLILRYGTAWNRCHQWHERGRGFGWFFLGKILGGLRRGRCINFLITLNTSELGGREMTDDSGLLVGIYMCLIGYQIYLAEFALCFLCSDECAVHAFCLIKRNVI